MTSFKSIVMNVKDNVCTVVGKVDPGDEVGFDIEGKPVFIRVTDPIPLGHKIAIRDIGQGEAIIKYGEVIGLATQSITTGQHVHVHNLESCRGRGDK